MKKRMFLSTILMTLVLLLAVTTATFAWYQASGAQATPSYQSAAAISTGANTFGEGSFDVKISVNAAATNLAFTDENGLTAYYLADGTTLVENVAIPVEQVAQADGTVTITITYTGALEDDADILAAWTQLSKSKIAFDLVASNDVKLAKTGNAYEATANNTLQYTNVSLGTVAFTDGVYTLTVAESFVYAIAGLNEVQTSVSNGTITVQNGVLS